MSAFSLEKLSVLDMLKCNDVEILMLEIIEKLLLIEALLRRFTKG